MRIQLADDMALYFDVDGSGLRPCGPHMRVVPTLLLLHGGPGFDHTHFKPGYSSLSDVAQIIYLDQRGQGRSDRGQPEQWRLEQWADDVAAFCRSLQISKPIVLGASFGGFVAYALAVRHPELMAGTIIVSSAACITRERVVGRFGELGGETAAEAARAFFAAPSAATLDTYTKVCFPLYSRNGMDPAVGTRSIINHEVLFRFMRPGGEWSTFNLLDDLRRVRARMLLLHGARDAIVPLENAKASFEALPGRCAQLHVLEEAGHNLYDDNPEELFRLIRGFIAEVQPRADLS